MADPDIPMAYASPVTPMASPRPYAPLMTEGRSSHVLLPKQKSKVMTDPEIRVLMEQGFPRGLAEAMTKNNEAFPLRIWVVDNSGSMTKSDGHRMVETKKKDDVKIVSCTRWTEIQETVDYHAQMAALLQAPTVFRLLNDPGKINGPQQFSIAERGEEHLNEDLMIAHKTMRTSPGGVTPLAEHVREIRENIRSMESSLQRDGTKVVVVLATDGLPTDIRGICDTRTKRELVDALRLLEYLPVWVVIRLCTDEEDVVEFYNQLDSQLELPLEVLDDFEGEAKEVYEHNKFLNYALPLHRCREMGYHDRLFDLLDERKLTKDELRDLFALLFGEAQFDGVPDPQADWVGFVKALSKIVEKEKGQWNPMTKKVQPWVDMKKLNKAYGGGSCSVM
jgi:Mg-chelatase subunit ChlD